MFDFLILTLILLSAFFAFFRGFSLELLSISGWIISFLGSYIYGNNLMNFFNKYINNIFISTILSYILIFLTILIIFSIFTKKFSSYIKESFVGLVDKSLGFVFGMLRGYLLISLCFFAFDYFYQGEKIEFIEKSKFIPIIKITNNIILDTMNVDNNYSKRLNEEIRKKSDLLFEKSIDSKLKLKNNSNKDSEIYDSSGRKNLENIIENNLE
ncbi:MAG: CvpA family protein [Pseudomonadota bacterium]|nr:CvpA family protein [Pseudomonadota bacterium]